MATRNETANVNGMVKQAQDIKGYAADVAHDIMDTSARKAHAAADYVGERVDDLKDTGAKAVKKAESRVKEKPVQSLAIAFGAGMLVSYLLNRTL